MYKNANRGFLRIIISLIYCILPRYHQEETLLFSHSKTGCVRLPSGDFVY